MQKPLAKPSVDVRRGPHYSRNIEQLRKQHPSVEQDVEAAMQDVIVPAVIADPINPYKQAGGTPVILGTYSKRVANSSGATGRRGGFRLLYHWDRHKKRLTLLAISLRRDRVGFPASAVTNLLKHAGI